MLRIYCDDPKGDWLSEIETMAEMTADDLDDIPLENGGLSTAFLAGFLLERHGRHIKTIERQDSPSQLAVTFDDESRMRVRCDAPGAGPIDAYVKGKALAREMITSQTHWLTRQMCGAVS